MPTPRSPRLRVLSKRWTSNMTDRIVREHVLWSLNQHKENTDV